MKKSENKLEAPRPPIDTAKWLKKLLSENQKERHKAVMAIGGLEPADNWMIAPFLEGLGSANDDIVFFSTVGLGRMRECGKSSLDALAAVARTHPLIGVRQSAVAALVKIAPAAMLTKLVVFELFADDSSYVRRDALQASIKLAEHTAADLQRIAAMGADPDGDVSRWSEIALRNIRFNSGDVAQ